MGADTIPSRSNGQTIDQTWFNLLKTIFAGDMVPRNSSGVATTLAGSLGNSTYKWLKAHIESGYWNIGDVKMHHSYNGAVGPGHGWMLCDGRLVNETNYDAEHGAGSWATYIGSSSLDGKNLPNMGDKYPVGAATTTQDGTSAITSVGNASHQVDLQHSHTVNSHSHTVNNHFHQWYEVNAANADDQTWDVAGALQKIPDNTTKNATFNGIDTFTNGSSFAPDTDMYTKPDNPGTSSENPGTDNQLSATEDIQPESIQYQFYMRVI